MTGQRDEVDFQTVGTVARIRSFESRMIALHVRDVGVAGSNPATPTIFSAQK